jgi:D-sedoheptulose 7-phosphate isomerase
MSLEKLHAELQAHTQALERTVRESGPLIAELAACLSRCFRGGNKVLLCGNGGSAADAQHVAAELVNRFRRERKALPAIALTTDTSLLTSIANDASFEQVYARQVEALAAPGDVLIAISTSGQSPNVLCALDAARACGAVTVGLTGERGRKTMGDRCDHCLIVPCSDTARIQEVHEFVLHVVCGLVEDALEAASGGG